MKVILYADLLSQPSRAVYVFIKMNGIEHELKQVRLAKLENRSEEYIKINPLKKVPSVQVIKQDGTSSNIYESLSIMKYICRLSKLNKWYPENDYEQCKMIDISLDFYLSILRPNCVNLVFNGLFAKNMGLKVPTDFTIERASKKVHHTLVDFQKVFLQTGDCFVGNRSEISISDIVFFCEIVQLLMIKQFEFWKDERLRNINEWMHRMYRVREVREVHVQFGKVVKKQNEEGFDWLNQQCKL